MPVDALAGFVLHLGEEQTSDLPPSQDIAVREILRRLGVDHQVVADLSCACGV
jgi:hypothetical protein